MATVEHTVAPSDGETLVCGACGSSWPCRYSDRSRHHPVVWPLSDREIAERAAIAGAVTRRRRERARAERERWQASPEGWREVRRAARARRHRAAGTFVTNFLVTSLCIWGLICFNLAPLAVTTDSLPGWLSIAAMIGGAINVLWLVGGLIAVVAAGILER